MSAMGGKTERVREDAARLAEEIGNVRNAAGKLFGDVRETVDALDIKSRVQANPLGTVAAAAGIGFVLGGGLFRPIFSRAIRLGVKLALVPYVKNQLFRYAATALAGQQQSGFQEQGDLGGNTGYAGGQGFGGQGGFGSHGDSV